MAHPYWPFFDLRIRTPRLELHVPNDDDRIGVRKRFQAAITSH